MADNIGLTVIEQLNATAEVSALTSTRNYRGFLPQSATLEATVTRVISNNSIEDLSSSSGMATARVRIDCYDSIDGTEANTLAETIRTKALPPNKIGNIGSSNLLYVREISHDNGPAEVWEQPIDGSDQWRMASRIEFMISYDQTTP